MFYGEAKSDLTRILSSFCIHECRQHVILINSSVRLSDCLFVCIVSAELSLFAELDRFQGLTEDSVARHV